MSIDVRPSEDSARYLATDQLVWFAEVTSRDVEQLRGVPADQRFVVDLPDGPTDTHSGIYGVRPMDLTAPGGALLPVAGLTWVGVHPDSRRRGVLSAMVTDHLSRTRTAGLAVSALHASEHKIYGRYGYGMAALQLQVELGRGTELEAPHLADEVAMITTHLVTGNQAGVTARIRECFLREASGWPGTLVGSRDFIDLWGLEWPEELRDKEPRRFLFARRDGQDVGVVGLRREHKWENARPSGTVSVGTFVGGAPARLALMRRVLDLDLMGTTRLENVGVDEPVLSWVGGPRGTADIKTWDSTWIRLVDLEAAWQLRTYEADCNVVVELEDRFAPWNAGRWRLVASDGAGTAIRTEDDAEITLDVAVLGAGYLGHGTAGLARAGVVREHRPDAFAELARAMHTAIEPEPSVDF